MQVLELRTVGIASFVPELAFGLRQTIRPASGKSRAPSSNPSSPLLQMMLVAGSPSVEDRATLVASSLVDHVVRPMHTLCKSATARPRLALDALQQVLEAALRILPDGTAHAQLVAAVLDLVVTDGTHQPRYHPRERLAP
jgi:hypothetical protein